MPFTGIKSEKSALCRKWQHINLQLSDDSVTFDMANGVMTLTVCLLFLERDFFLRGMITYTYSAVN